MKDISFGINLFNDSDFFSAHDFFEDIWLDADKSEKEFFQGLVQISVGCYHLICGNKRGSINQLNKGINKLKKYQPDFYKIKTSDLIYDIEQLLLSIECNKNINNFILTIKINQL